MIYLVMITLFFGLIAFGIWMDHISYKKDSAENELNAKNWFEQELKKPMFKVVVFNKTASFYESKAFKPYYELAYFLSRDTYYTYTSKELAEKKVESSFKNGRYFHQETDTYIPVCDIKSIKVVEAD